MVFHFIKFLVLLSFCFISLGFARVNKNVFILREYLSGSENYLRKSSIKSLRIRPEPLVFNRLYLTPHEVLNFEVKSLKTELPQKKVISLQGKSFEKYRAPLYSRQFNLEDQIPEVEADVININKSNKLDSGDVLPLLIRSELRPNVSVDLPALISLEPKTEDFTGTGSAKIE